MAVETARVLLKAHALGISDQDAVQLAAACGCVPAVAEMARAAAAAGRRGDNASLLNVAGSIGRQVCMVAALGGFMSQG